MGDKLKPNHSAHYMDYSTSFFIDDDEIFDLFAKNEKPYLIKSHSYRLNVSNGNAELTGMKGNILAIRRLQQPQNIIRVKLGTGADLQIAKELKKLGFAPHPSSIQGFSEFREVAAPPAGYTQQSDRLNTIWRTWWPIKDKRIEGRAAVLVFHDGKWQDAIEIETGVKARIVTRTQQIAIADDAEITWAVDTRFARRDGEASGFLKQQQVQNKSANYTDERMWGKQAVLTTSKATFADIMREIDTNSHRWIQQLQAVDTEISGLLDQTRSISQRKQEAIQTLEFLSQIAKSVTNDRN